MPRHEKHAASWLSTVNATGKKAFVWASFRDRLGDVHCHVGRTPYRHEHITKSIPKRFLQTKDYSIVSPTFCCGYACVCVCMWAFAVIPLHVYKCTPTEGVFMDCMLDRRVVSIYDDTLLTCLHLLCACSWWKSKWGTCMAPSTTCKILGVRDNLCGACLKVPGGKLFAPVTLTVGSLSHAVLATVTLTVGSLSHAVLATVTLTVVNLSHDGLA